MITYTIYPQGDKAVTVNFGDYIHIDIHRKVISFTKYIESHPFSGLLEVIPSFTSVTITYEPIMIEASATNNSPFDIVSNILKSMLSELPETIDHPAKTVTIPVCYGGDYGPDLQEVADYHQVTQQEIISIHSSQVYLVYMIGFAPGFPYLGGMSKEIATPRKATPRLKIPAGSVGIGGEQTGVYPIESPGGWQIIGRTPLQLFQQDAKQPSLLQAGDLVRIQPITLQEFKSWGADGR
ncbi:5-oxoprolinase subunit PxpB [uncultured Metabacillus sp.]|uniref:5-oxoprolinase subunit PxpB n=1 Tax=uncultured Metabacillus sp. TaxID=2860135 RepID=UPI0026033FB5|nr:5-oxoprolinase subunit PxpB [uncultured Metabacillus sp.]